MNGTSFEKLWYRITLAEYSSTSTGEAVRAGQAVVDRVVGSTFFTRSRGTGGPEKLSVKVAILRRTAV
jgi:hypothetical protein